MKHLILHIASPVLIAIASTLGAGAFVGACAAPAKNVRTALEIAQLACVLAEANTDAATVAKICGIADQYIPDIEQLLSAKKEAARLKAAASASTSASSSASPALSASAKGK